MRRVNVNFILAIAVIVVMVLAAAGMGLVVNGVSQELIGIESDMDELRGDGEVEDVEGYALIGNGLAYGLGAIGYAVVMTVVVMVGMYAILLFIIAVVARIAFAKSGGRLLAYRILMGIEYFLQAVLASVLLSAVTIIPPTIVLVLLLIGSIVYSARNTYSDRIYAEE